MVSFLRVSPTKTLYAPLLSPHVTKHIHTNKLQPSIEWEMSLTANYGNSKQMSLTSKFRFRGKSNLRRSRRPAGMQQRMLSPSNCLQLSDLVVCRINKIGTIQRQYNGGRDSYLTGKKLRWNIPAKPSVVLGDVRTKCSEMPEVTNPQNSKKVVIFRRVRKITKSNY